MITDCQKILTLTYEHISLIETLLHCKLEKQNGRLCDEALILFKLNNYFGWTKQNNLVQNAT